jgi:hypothetical protein
VNPLVIVLPVVTGLAAWLFSRGSASASAPSDAPELGDGEPGDAERDTLPPSPPPSSPSSPSPSLPPPSSYPTPPAPDEPKPKAKKKPASVSRTPKAAAQALFEYVTAAIAAGRGATLGTKSEPNAIVRDAQADMDNIDVDGVYGPATRTRGKELLGKTFPPRPSSSSSSSTPATTATAPVLNAEPVRLEEPPAPAPPAAAKPKPKAKPPASSPRPAPAPQPAPPPAAAAKPKAKAPASSPQPAAATRSPQDAAQALFDYVTAAIAAGRARTLGNKSEPNAIVRDAQADMGELVADGIYGPASRARGKALLGRNFPARS